VVAIYARENGQGMAFPMPSGTSEGASEGGAAAAGEGSPAAGTDRPRGLRLARTDAPSGPTAAPAPASAEATDGDEPPPPPRPALKRVK